MSQIITKEHIIQGVGVCIGLYFIYKSLSGFISDRN